MSDRVTATTGGTERLACSAVGLPAPRIVWYKDGVPLVDHHEEDVVVVDSVRATNQLILRHLAPDDSGQYRCTALNDRGNVSFTYNLHVVGQQHCF